ncbi:hypothetical protein TanjilG_24460 [Lupinus angustifolius]|uniref:Uncharacterized protein n=1 Tax=Lupinus angustifolius TaxID=3871 RepID=A0A1J7GX88_LUPAN|nr:hypothetical protein TanjilG_24460 [Lupinus angustifolius]
MDTCAKLKSLEDGRKVNSIATSNGRKIEEALGAKLDFMYVNYGDLIEGRRIFDKTLNDKELRVSENAFAFTYVLKCFAA